MTIVRFAPSPTGRIHIGNARTAILNWLYSRKTGGRFVLRFDDTDRERSTEEFARGIAEDLAWLGIDPDRVERQSQRFERYDAAAGLREDGTYLYTLPSVVDDIDFDVTTVIRGEDHVVNTAVQIEIFEALGARVPEFAHHSLLTGKEGTGLSKRLGSLSIKDLREEGLEAMAVVSHAALLGTSESIHPCADYRELIEGFEFHKLSRAPARFDEGELRNLNARLLHILPYPAVEHRLGFGNEAFWLAVRGNLQVLADARKWWTIVSGEITPVIAEEDREFVRLAAAQLPPEPWTTGTWNTWTASLKHGSARKGRMLFMPLRLALTGLDHGRSSPRCCRSSADPVRCAD